MTITDSDQTLGAVNQLLYVLFI